MTSHIALQYSVVPTSTFTRDPYPSGLPALSIAHHLIFISLGILLVFAPLFQGGTTHLAVMIIRLLILLLFVVYLWVHIVTGRVRGFPTDIGLTIMAYLGVAVISGLYSPYSHQSFQWLIVLCSYSILLYVLVSFSFTWADIAKLLAILCVMASFEAGLAISQAAWIKTIRPTGTFFNPNFLALSHNDMDCYTELSPLCGEKKSLHRWEKHFLFYAHLIGSLS